MVQLSKVRLDDLKFTAKKLPPNLCISAELCLLFTKITKSWELLLIRPASSYPKICKFVQGSKTFSHLISLSRLVTSSFLSLTFLVNERSSPLCSWPSNDIPYLCHVEYQLYCTN